MGVVVVVAIDASVGAVAIVAVVEEIAVTVSVPAVGAEGSVGVLLGQPCETVVVDDGGSFAEDGGVVATTVRLTFALKEGTEDAKGSADDKADSEGLSRRLSSAPEAEVDDGVVVVGSRLGAAAVPRGEKKLLSDTVREIVDDDDGALLRGALLSLATAEATRVGDGAAVAVATAEGSSPPLDGAAAI